MDCKGNVTCSNGDLILAAAVAGAGIISLPDFIVSSAIKEGKLVPILKNYEFPEVGIYAVYPPTRHLSAKIRAFVNSLVAYFARRPDWLLDKKPTISN